MIDIHQKVPILLISTPFARFQICPTFAVHPNLILEPCQYQTLREIIWLGNELKVLGPMGAKFQWLTLRVSRSPSCKVTESQDLEDSNFEGYMIYIGIYEISQNYLQGLKKQLGYRNSSATVGNVDTVSNVDIVGDVNIFQCLTLSKLSKYTCLPI